MKKIIFLIVIIALSPLVNAFGATAPYWKEKPLILAQGETKTFPIMLQNMVGEKDITLKAELISGKEIAALEDPDKSYLVSFGKKDVPINLKIQIPENDEIGKNYTIAIFFKQISSQLLQSKSL